MKKITKATVKAFMRKNMNRLYLKELSRFDGMYDCVMSVENAGFRNVSGLFIMPTKLNVGSCLDATCGINGVWFVGGSRNWFEAYNDGVFQGYKVGNCCGSFIVAVHKGQA